MASLTHSTPTRQAGQARWLAALTARFRQPPHIWLLLAITALGLALRVWFIAVNELQPIYSPADDGDYYQRALRFATTGQYIDDFWLIRPPLHVMLFALMIRLSIWLGDVSGLLLIRGLQTVMIVLTIPLGYGLASRLFDRRAGLVFAFILAVWFPLVELPVHLFSEPTFFFFLVLHLWLLLRWRDTRHWRWLVAAGLALGLSSLARSPTLYGGAFVVLWLVLELTRGADVAEQQRLWFRRPRSWLNALRPRVVVPVLVFALSCAVVVLPWTLRNYLVYDRLILIDTIGPVNLWLHIEKYEARGVEMLKAMPQADRQVFAVEDTMRIFHQDPAGFLPLLFRNAEFHFRHVWKAQFVEDFFVKRSTYGRPLREFWVLGALGDLLWVTFTLAGLVALTAPQREGYFRWVALAWVGYTIFAMMIMHIEPRYLLPVWLMLALYGSWLLARPRQMVRLFGQHRLHAALAVVVAVAFVWLFWSYRDYPGIISRGITREVHNAAGMEALAAGDYATATRELQQAVDAHSGFTEIRSNLALTHAAQGNYDMAWQVLDGADSQRMQLIRGALEYATGDTQSAAVYFTDAETRAGEDIQHYALRWLPVPPTYSLNLGNGLDLGYVAGFSAGESMGQDGNTIHYRWLQGSGQIELPLPQPLREGSTIALRMTSGQPQAVPLTVGFGPDQPRVTLQVAGGKWRVYHLEVPSTLAGQEQVRLSLDAPVFIPAHRYSESVDVRPLSLMMSDIRVTPGP